MESFTVNTRDREELVDIAPEVEKALNAQKIRNGLCVIFVPHTTAGVTINENADPSVARDIIKGLRVIPERGYDHSEGNSPAHIKSSIIGQSITIIIKDGKPLFGRWQGIYFAEFDGPRKRSVWVKIIKS